MTLFLKRGESAGYLQRATDEKAEDDKAIKKDKKKKGAATIQKYNFDGSKVCRSSESSSFIAAAYSSSGASLIQPHSCSHRDTAASEMQISSFVSGDGWRYGERLGSREAFLRMNSMFSMRYS